MKEIESLGNPFDPISSAPEEIKNLIIKILKLENERLYEERPRLRDEIMQIVKEEIK